VHEREQFVGRTMSWDKAVVTVNVDKLFLVFLVLKLPESLAPELCYSCT
jgi:hypothetical protein